MTPAARWAAAVALQHDTAAQLERLGDFWSHAEYIVGRAHGDLDRAWRAQSSDDLRRMIGEDAWDRAFLIVEESHARWRRRVVRQCACARSEQVRLGVVTALARVPELVR